MKRYDAIDQIPYDLVREHMLKAYYATMANLKALNAYYVERDDESPIISPYFGCKENDGSGYVGDERCVTKQYTAAWSYKLGVNHNGAQDLGALYNGYCNSVLAFEAYCE